MSEAKADDGMVRSQLTDESVDLMRRRIGYLNPTLRTGAIDDPWNMVSSDEAVRRWTICLRDTNHLWRDRDYPPKTRCGRVIAPPAFEKSMGINRAKIPPEPENKITSKPLRGVQLYHSGGENFYYSPIV